MRGARIFTAHSAIKARISAETASHPLLPRRIFHVQNIRNAVRCHAIRYLASRSPAKTASPARRGKTRPRANGRTNTFADAYGALHDSELVTQRNVLKLDSSSALSCDNARTSRPSQTNVESRNLPLACNSHDLNRFGIYEKDSLRRDKSIRGDDPLRNPPHGYLG